MTWTFITTIAGIATAVGIGIDWWMLDEEKNRLYNKLKSWWQALANTKVPELHRLMAEHTLKFVKQVFRWKFWSWQSFVMCIAISWVMSSVAFLGGLYLQVGNIATMFDVSPVPLPFYPTYMANFPFDLLTVAITIGVITAVLRMTVIWVGALIVADLTLAILLATLCFAAVNWMATVPRQYEWPGHQIVQDYGLGLETIGFTKNAKIQISRQADFMQALRDAFYVLTSLVIDGDLRLPEVEWITITVTENDRVVTMSPNQSHSLTAYRGLSTLFFASTTLIPTAIYLTILLILIFGKLVIEGSRRIVLRILKVMTQRDPQVDPDKFIPGTRLGLLAGIVAAFAKGVVDLLIV